MGKVIKAKRTGILRVYRKMFGDPLLYVSFLKGIPVYAYSFLVKDRWYDGLLSQEEVENNLFGNLFEYAFKKYGQDYIKHMTEYSNRVIYDAITGALENNWDLDVEFVDEDEDTVRQSVGIVSVKTEIESFAKTLQSLGARDIYIPSLDKVIGYTKSEDIKEVYRFINERFGEGEMILSTPFTNIFLIYKKGKPLIFSTESVLIEEEENIINILKASEKKKFERDFNEGDTVDIPAFKTYGKPFLLAFRKNDDFLVIHIKGRKVILRELKDLKKIFRTIMEYNEKLSMLLYRALEKKTNIRSQDIIDVRLRILMMKHPNPDEFEEIIRKEKF